MRCDLLQNQWFAIVAPIAPTVKPLGGFLLYRSAHFLRQAAFACLKKWAAVGRLQTGLFQNLIFMPIEFLHLMISKGHDSIPDLCRCAAGGRPRQSLILAATIVLITSTKNPLRSGCAW